MSAPDQEKHVTPPNRNKKSTKEIVEEAQKEYRKGKQGKPGSKRDYPARVPGTPDPK